MSPRSRFIIFLTAIIGLALLLVLIFGGKKNSSNTSTKKPTAQQGIALVDYAERDSKVVFTIDGQINSEEQHRSIRITVGRGSKMVEVVKGYENTVLSTKSFDNNPEAYKTFLYALTRLNYAKQRTIKQTNDRAVCPQGRRYISELYDNNDQKMRLWTASCQKGTSSANYAQVQSLFQNQIPDYGKLVGNVQL